MKSGKKELNRQEGRYVEIVIFFHINISKKEGPSSIRSAELNLGFSSLKIFGLRNRNSSSTVVFLFKRGD